MRVVVIASSRYPVGEPFAGGLESLTWQLCRGLRDRGVEVTIFAGPGSDPLLRARELSVRPLELSQAARSDVSMPPLHWLTEHHAYLQVMLWLQRSGDVDVVHNNSLHHLPVAMASAVPAPVLTTLHTPPTPWLEHAIAIADAAQSRYVAVSAHTAQAWRHVAHAAVVPNGVDIRRWQAGPGGAGLAWAGRIVPQKAPHLAVAAARQAGRPLRLAGPIGDRTYFERELAPRLDPDAQYLGHLTCAQLQDLFGSSAATLVTPQWDEPYGLVAAESLACGTPVAAINRGGLSEFVAPDVGVLVRDGDVSALADAVGRAVLLDRTACRRHAVQRCSVDRMVEDYLAVYHSMAGRRAA